MATLTSTGRFAAGEACADNDIFYGPYATIAAAHAALLNAERNVVGRTVGIQTGNTIEEYWYQGGTNQVNLVKKQTAVEVDVIPTQSSSNAVSSGGVYNALQGKANTSDIPTISTNITTDATSDAKTASPKAVKTYVDNGLTEKQNTISVSSKISSDFVDDTDKTNKFVTSTEKGLIGTAIQGVKKGTETLTPVNGVVTIPSDIEGAHATSVASNQSATANIDSNHVLQLEIPRGSDAYNPFKGIYITTSDTNIPSSGQAGDYIFIADANPATTIDLYFWNTAKTPSAGWDDTGYDIAPGSLAEFADGTAVSMVHIINDFTTGGIDNVASAESVRNLHKDISGEKRFVNGKYIQNNGNESSNDSWACSPFIPVIPGESYEFDYGELLSSPTVSVVFYKQDKTSTGSYNTETDTNRTLTAPSVAAGKPFDGYYARFSFNPSYNAKVKHGNDIIYSSFDLGLADDVATLEVKVEDMYDDWAKKTNVIDGKYVNALNGIVTNADYRYTEYIDVTAGETIKLDYGDAPIQLYAVFVKSDSTTTYYSLDEHTKTREIEVPANAVQMRFSCPITHNPLVLKNGVVIWKGIIESIPDRIDELEREEESLSARVDAIEVETIQTNTNYKGNEIQVFTKGVAIGDSLTAGAFNYNYPSSGISTISRFSYPVQLEKMTGIEIENKGLSGYTTEQTYNALENEDLSGNEFAIIQLGVNDHADGAATQTWPVADETAMRNLITKLQNENNGIFVFVATIIPATSYAGRDYISAAIRDLVEDINDNHVILLDMAEYSHVGDASGYNNGHLSAIGYNRLATDYKNYISYVISQNKELFRNVQFIGSSYRY